ncbi:230_t:CDS:2 [Diversispora eburnea]|uniref:230_t:CDS:1 n=1 Tax=Diversispora eburnea TaxID=1213867 RepID=A0A9N8ZGQ0_9GLOM|nr:230_t:CDS:2 [Diversispora eburnea]
MTKSIWQSWKSLPRRGITFALVGSYVADSLEEKYPDTTGIFIKKNEEETSTKS